MADQKAEWMAAMRRGNYTAAWAVNDAVLAARDSATRDDPRLPYHERWVWDGRSFRNRHVLVRCYHGLGDTLLFCRYLAPLRAQAASVTLELQPELMELLATVPGPDRIVPFVADAPAPLSECDLEIMELAHALRLPPNAVPPPPLRVDADPEGQGAVGLCWTASDPVRTMPVSPLIPLMRARRSFTLQRGPCESLPVANPQGCPARIAATASLVAGLDAVVTVDTMIAHLAGALGRPTALLLPYIADWRWVEGCAGTPWYPTMRLYRQPAAGMWATAVDRAIADLYGISLVSNKCAAGQCLPVEFRSIVRMGGLPGDLLRKLDHPGGDFRVRSIQTSSRLPAASTRPEWPHLDHLISASTGRRHQHPRATVAFVSRSFLSRS